MNLRVIVGLLGWSNKRSGVEFYRWDDKIIPRHGSEWGDLLALDSDIAKSEGSPVIVIVLPRSSTADEVTAITQLVANRTADESICAICGHEWRRHDPEDGRCDAHTGTPRRFGVCECGRDLGWMQKRIAALSSKELSA